MTCRALLEPTLDALWETQYEIWNLIKCFPEGLTSWKTVSVRENEYSEPYNIWVSISFNREPVPSDWVRFRYYSRRIRHIYLNHEYAYDPPVRPPSEARARSKEDSRDDDNDRTSRPSFEGYATLMKASRPLLPNVRSIHWRECPRFYETLEPFIPMFAGPHLLSLAISCPAKYDGDTSISSASDAMMEALHSLPSLSPSLQFLEFGFYLDRYVVSGISRVISRLRKLRVMAYRSASRLTFDEYVTLSSLPHLQRICGKLASETIPTYIRNNRNNSPLIFGALTSLELHDMATINDVQDIFASSKFPVLRKLVLDRDRRFPQSHEEHTSAILTQLQCCTTHHLLKEIEVDMKPRHYPRGLYLCPSAPIPDITIVSPLFAFHNLERVVISSEKTLCLCDNDVASFALAWPHLRELTLLEFMCEDDWDYKELGRHSRPTLVGLVLLAHKCQSLTKLFVTALPTLSCNSCAGSSALRGEYCDNVVSAETPTARRSSPKFPDSQKAERFDWDLSNFGPDQENDIPSITRSRAIYHEIEMHEQARGRDPPSWAAIRKHCLIYVY
ncbi:hypothetical protein K474DRAFT_457346 [Panus rudis PR-1116 ss-1]|nr:hypothetical protein K474DRAFT_457346 [Panus rudis PR-1116 ss-1]